MIKIIDLCHKVEKENLDTIPQYTYARNDGPNSHNVSIMLRALYAFVSALPKNILFDAGFRYQYTRKEEFSGDTKKNWVCSCHNIYDGWRSCYLNRNVSYFGCRNKPSTAQGVLTHIYKKAFKSDPICLYHAATYYYLFYLYGGEKDVERSKKTPSCRKCLPPLFVWKA